MMLGQRHHSILKILEEKPDVTVKELASMLSVSEPTIRRDFTELANKGMITKVYGGATLNQGAADREIPFFFREQEKNSVKTKIGEIASYMVQDGMVIMLDGSTSAYHLVPYLAKYKDLIVITSGAKTAVALAEQNIRTFSTGGQMVIHSFSYVGKQAEEFVENFNADILFFSCHGLTSDGMMTDLSVEEANLRMSMFRHCKKKVLLCDSSKWGQSCFYNIGHISLIDEIVAEKPLSKELKDMLSSKKS